MRRVAAGLVVLLGSSAGIGVVLLAACGGGNSGSGFSSTDSGTTTVALPDGNVVTVPIPTGDGSTPILNPGQTVDAGAPIVYGDGGCAGLQCAISATCKNDGGTTITGKVLDPAGANPLYNVLAYVPMFDPADPAAIPAGQGIQPIAGGVTFPSGVACDSCSYLYSGNPIAVGTTGTDGTFTITNAPSGKNIPVVVQVGKWRTHTTVSTVTDCQSASAGDIKLPGSADGSDPIVSMPQIAISMGGQDSLECLPYRLGISLSEFTSGASSTGHLHVFTGGALGGGIFGNAPPKSSTSMWDSLADLEKYDVSLFSCEGSETSAANPQLLEQYVNAGGRAFLSHFHYAWLAGPLSNPALNYTANADWGSNLATWNPSGQAASAGYFGAEVTTTLNVGGGPFAKGIALQEWLGNVGALGTNGQKSNEVAIDAPAFDAKVQSSNVVSQQWASYDTTDSSGQTYPSSYFSFNTPVGATAPPDGGSAPYCGRVVFSGLHVGAAAKDTTRGVTMPSATTCNPAPGTLTPQEKVLEFILFDLSSCVTPDKAPPAIPIPPPPPPSPPK